MALHLWLCACPLAERSRPEMDGFGCDAIFQGFWSFGALGPVSVSAARHSCLKKFRLRRACAQYLVLTNRQEKCFTFSEFHPAASSSSVWSHPHALGQARILGQDFRKFDRKFACARSAQKIVKILPARAQRAKNGPKSAWLRGPTSDRPAVPVPRRTVHPPPHPTHATPRTPPYST